MIIRLEQPEDYFAVEQLTYAAFLTMDLPGRTRTDEHFLVHVLRDSPAFIPELDFVAEIDGQIVANIMYTKSKIIHSNGAESETVTFGPVSVLPEWQIQGIGSALIRHSLDRAGELGYRAVVIIGHAAYYPRFGFQPASEHDLTLPDGTAFDAFMARELVAGALGNRGGIWYEDEVFHIDEAALAAYNREFFAEGAGLS